MRAITDVFAALERSPFRRRFRLGPAERATLAGKGLEAVRAHARRIVRERLAPAHPRNDGRQTPMRGHPVFIAQHATATCCRGCLGKWHDIGAGRALSAEEEAHAVAAIMRWIEAQDVGTQAGEITASREPQLKLDLK
jgi:hypothetical protein